MRFIGSFYQFAQRVLEAAKKGGLAKNDVAKLERLFERTAKRNIILAKGILSALSAGGAKEADIQRFSALLEKANERISIGKEPFTPSDKQELSDIFKRAYISTKAAEWFATQIDELLAEEIDDFIKGRRAVAVPTKKVFTFGEKTKEEKATTKT
jgi:hypothetical protein